MRQEIDCIIIDDQARHHPMVARFLERFPDARIIDCTPGDRLTVCRKEVRSPKRTVYLAHHRGSFLKPFPHHKWYGDHLGCYHNLILGYNCFASCRYCFIQTIFDTSVPAVYVNSDEMTTEVAAFLSANPDAIISTGEYIDSLQLDEVTGYTKTLTGLFDRFPKSTLELRTKSDHVSHLPDDPPHGVLVSYSINPPDVVDIAEPGTVDLDARLGGAKHLHDKGYRIAFRLDPIVPAEEFVGGYRELPAFIQKSFGWDKISRVFLGALRFDHALLKKMCASIGGRRLLDAEFVPCPDGYFRPTKYSRIRAYRSLVSEIQRYTRDIDISITMEPDYVRRAVFAA
ncbi:MAG: hypothetical protein JSW58_08815 [Candidatus Latescibacterota bacterium]|nr:MAG: hypothetical protein JSW58_08815 [Candidatus Latescibacterota bacterium]